MSTIGGNECWGKEVMMGGEFAIGSDRNNLIFP